MFIPQKDLNNDDSVSDSQTDIKSDKKLVSTQYE